jgi:putative addiction module CopG family antidote
MSATATLSPKHQAYVNALVKSGKFASPADVVGASIDLMQQYETKLARFDTEIKKGIDDFASGRFVSLEDARHRLAARFSTSTVNATA